jgi:hypothetical protein
MIRHIRERTAWIGIFGYFQDKLCDGWNAVHGHGPVIQRSLEGKIQHGMRRLAHRRQRFEFRSTHDGRIFYNHAVPEDGSQRLKTNAGCDHGLG